MSERSDWSFQSVPVMSERDAGAPGEGSIPPATDAGWRRKQNAALLPGFAGLDGFPRCTAVVGRRQAQEGVYCVRHLRLGG